MEKCIYYNEVLIIESSNLPVDIFYDFNEDSVELSISGSMNLHSLEKLSKGLLKFVNDVKKDQIKNK